MLPVLRLLLPLLLHAHLCLGYTNNFPEVDNAFGVRLPTANVRNASFAFLVADFGLPPPGTTRSPLLDDTFGLPFAGDDLADGQPGQCCQTDVADMMRAKRKELEAAGKSLLFVGAAGDNFYHSGLLDEDKGGDLQWARWSAVYSGLTDVRASRRRREEAGKPRARGHTLCVRMRFAALYGRAKGTRRVGELSTLNWLLCELHTSSQIQTTQTDRHTHTDTFHSPSPGTVVCGLREPRPGRLRSLRHVPGEGAARPHRRAGLRIESAGCEQRRIPPVARQHHVVSLA